MLPPPRVKLFRGDSALDIEVSTRSCEVAFSTEQEERAYELLDWELRERVRKVLSAQTGRAKPEAPFHVIDDWWPNRTIAIEAAPSALTPRVLAALQSLLSAEYADWSIAIEVYGGQDMEAAENLGPLHIYASQILTLERFSQLVASEA